MRMVTGLHLPFVTRSATRLQDVVNGSGKSELVSVRASAAYKLCISPYTANPAYKGKWYAPMIDNPEYKGEWAPRKIDNPDFFEDLSPVKSLKAIVSCFFSI